jgi:signal transduction histidine kinase
MLKNRGGNPPCKFIGILAKFLPWDNFTFVVMASRSILLVAFLLSTPLPEVTGQNDHLIAELRGRLKAGKLDRFELLNDLAWEFRFAYPDSTIYYSTQAFELGQSLSLSKGLSRPLNYIGVAYDKKGEPINAYDSYVKAMSMAEQQRDSSQIAYSHNNIGRLFFDQGIHSKALLYFIQAKKLFESQHDPAGLAYVHQSLGRIHDIQKDFKKAEENFRQAYWLRLQLGNARDIMAALVFLGTLYKDEEKIDSALQYFLKADSVGKTINDRINLAEIQIHLAECYLSKGQLDSAQRLSASGLKVITALKAMGIMARALLVRGQVMAALFKSTEARGLYLRALEITDQTKELEERKNAHYLLWKLAEQEGKQRESTLHHNQFLIIQDTLKDLEVTRHLERFQFESEIQKKDLESQFARAKAASTIQAARWQNIILGSVAFLTLLATFIFRRNSRQAKKINQRLVEQNHKLEELNHEKDTLMNIVAHDLKSPLNRISGLVHLMEIDRSPESLAQYLNITKKTTQAGLTLIGDLLDVNAATASHLNPEMKSVDLCALIDVKIESFTETAREKSIAITKLQGEKTVVQTDPEFINRILDNLLSNAIKFSHPNSNVAINYGRTEGNFFISVKDSGPGFSDDDQAKLYQKFRRLSARPTGGESSNGLGLALIKYLVDRLNGTIELNSKDRKGSEFIVTIPYLPD